MPEAILSSDSSEFRAAFAAGQRDGDIRYARKPGPGDEVGEPFVVVPSDSKVESVERFLPAPGRTKINAVFTEAASFVEYVRRFLGPVDETNVTNRTYSAAALFQQADTFECILDFDAPGKPSWRSHYASYRMEETPEWRKWKGSNRMLMDQTKFAEFIEDNIIDIHAPPGAQLLEMVTTLATKTEVSFTSAVRLSNGNVQCLYHETTEAKAGQQGELVMPGQFVLGIKLYREGTAYKVTARLRSRINHPTKKLSFEYQIENLDRLLETARLDVRNRIETGTGLKALAGWRAG